MRVPVLSDGERRLLMDYEASAAHKLVIKKAEALLLLSRDVAPSIVAELVDREPVTLKDWVIDWETQCMASLLTGHAGNLNRSFLTQDQREAVIQVLNQPPGDDYLSAQFWDVPYRTIGFPPPSTSSTPRVTHTISCADGRAFVPSAGEV